MGSDNSNVIEVKPINPDGSEINQKDAPMTPKDQEQVSEAFQFTQRGTRLDRQRGE